jgi:hypothetical protein
MSETKQERFVQEYLIEPNATKAAVRAGSFHRAPSITMSAFNSARTACVVRAFSTAAEILGFLRFSCPMKTAVLAL